MDGPMVSSFDWQGTTFCRSKPHMGASWHCTRLVPIVVRGFTEHSCPQEWGLAEIGRCGKVKAVLIVMGPV